MGEFRMKYLISGLVCLALLSQPAQAWNRKGHATIAAIAEANLTPAAQARVKALLKNDLDVFGQASGRTSLSEIASWADEMRDWVSPPSKVAHSRANPVCRDEPGPCKNGNCVDYNIRAYLAVLKSADSTQRERNEALKFVVHLVGDLHQPLHSGSNGDRAGKFSARLEASSPASGLTLHKLWDSNLLDAALAGSRSDAELKGAGKLPGDAIGQWMQEARQLSRQHVYEPLPGFACKVGFSEPLVLDEAYQLQAVPVIRLQIERAGLRLAQLLNQTLQ